MTIQIIEEQRHSIAPPAIILIDPKFAHNVGAVVRAASSFFGLSTVIYTGRRVRLELDQTKRLPREERMRGYADVTLVNHDYPFDLLVKEAVPVGVELLPGTTNLAWFEHPENAVYVFGPEDGGLSKSARLNCHYFVQIPGYHCLNLAAAVNVVLYDRTVKQWSQGGSLPALKVQPEFTDPTLYDRHSG